MKPKPFYITTAIDYPNALPHIGTAFEKVGADVQARFQEMNDRKVYLLMGQDENTQKVCRAATKNSEDIQKYVNRMAGNFRRSWDLLDVRYNEFCQTSAKNHHDFCQKFVQQVFDNGYIHSRRYEGLYCNECEEYKLTVTNGECQTHPGVKLQSRNENNYFFAQSKFLEPLLSLYEEGKIKIFPEHRQTEMINFVKTDLKDISISRQNQGWGIPIPWDNSQVIYVWFDALLNYMTWADGNWPADVHVIGKDIVRFHGALFPAMIMAHNTNVLGSQTGNIELPRKIFSHGFVCKKTHAGLTKFSKSAGDSFGPDGLVDTFGSDGYRYLFMKSANFADDAEYDFGMFAETYNADLVNKYGNLFSRVSRLVVSKFGGTVPAPRTVPWNLLVTPATPERWHRDMSEFRYRDVLVTGMEIIDKVNKLIDENKPWADDAVDAEETLAIATRTLKVIAFMFGPVMPKSSKLVWDALKYEGDPGFDNVCFETLNGYVMSSLPLTIDQNQVQSGKVTILFPRYKG